MAKETFEFARIGTREEIAEYLTSLAQGLKRGEVSLESGERVLRLVPASDVKLELRIKEREEKGKIGLEIGWKRRTATRATELVVQIPKRATRAART